MTVNLLAFLVMGHASLSVQLGTLASSNVDPRAGRVGFAIPAP